MSEIKTISKEMLFFALGVISRRISKLDPCDYSLLGLDECDDPNMNEVIDRCEEIVFNAIVNSSLCLPIV